MAEAVKLIAANKKAYHEYFILKTFEAGIALAGTEVKSVRMGKCSVKEAYVGLRGGEMVVFGMHISPYEKGNLFNKDPLRERKLLLHKSEIRSLSQQVKEKGVTLVPLRVYLKGGLVKLEIGLAKGKHLYDKREALAEKDAKREADRAIKSRMKDSFI